MKKILLGFMFICACATSYAYPSDLNITKSEGAYIRANFRTFFGKNAVCQNIGRTYVNFPAIYDGNRPDLDRAMLNLIRKDRSYNGQEQVGEWYFDNCVVVYPSGMKKIRALEYFYGHMMYFEGDQ